MDELIAALEAEGFTVIRLREKSAKLPVLVVGYNDVDWGAGDKARYPEFGIDLVYKWDTVGDEDGFTQEAMRVADAVWNLDPGGQEWLAGGYDGNFSDERRDLETHPNYTGTGVSAQMFYVTQTGYRPSGR